MPAQRLKLKSSLAALPGLASHRACLLLQIAALRSFAQTCSIESLHLAGILSLKRNEGTQPAGASRLLNENSPRCGEDAFSNVKNAFTSANKCRRHSSLVKTQLKVLPRGVVFSFLCAGSDILRSRSSRLRKHT
jgi:hypothetical protein